MRRRRPDATLADAAPYRRLMPLLMPRRNESVVFFEQEVDVAETEACLAEWNTAHPGMHATLFHVVTWALVRTLHLHPRLNRFAAGGRLWDRDGIWVTWSARKRLTGDAPVVAVKRRFDPEEPFEAVVTAMQADLARERSDEETLADRELRLLLGLPAPLAALALAAVRRLDEWGLLPGSFLESDPFHASLFLANLGSLRMDAGYHHLYEYGNIPIFCVIGRVHERPVVREGKLEVGRRAVLRFSYDERVEEGLYAQRALEHMRQLVERGRLGAP